MDETYSYRCGIYGNILINSNNKYCSVITRAVHNNEFDTETIKKMCDSLNNRTLESNGDLIVLIRLLYVDGIPLSTKELIVASLSKFIFWPHSSEDGEAFVNVMFWSESNILILLSSAVLFRQRNLVDADHRRICPTELEYQLLRCYLKAHVECSQKGSYEVLSLEHFPFALMALLNIVDFVMDFEFASLAMQLVDIMVTQLMHVTSASGVCCISSGARTNVDQRIRTWGHHINHFVYLLTGVHPNAKDTSLSNKILAKPGIGLGDAISARAVVNTSDRGSSYRIQPAPMAFSLKGGGQEYLEPCRLGDYLCCCEGFDPGSEATAAFLRQGYRQLAMNPSLEELQDFYTNYTPYAVNENESLEEKRLKRNKIMARNSKHNISTHSNKSGAENSSTIRLKPSMSGSGRGPRVYEVSLNGKFSLPMDPSGPEHSPGHSTPMSTIHRKRSKSMNSSNSISITLSNYPSGSAMKKDLSPFQCELIPFFWSAGLLAHRYFLFATKAYIKYRNLEGNKHLWLLSWLNTSVVDYLMKSYKQWTAGEAYVGMKYNIYKHDELLLTSFEKCNGGTCGYQMLPWIANFDGIGVWTQSGSGNESIGDVTVTNTHTPHVSQLGHILVAAYSTPRALTMAMGPGAVFNSIVKLYWPSSDLLHNEERTDLRGFRTAVEPMDSSLKGTLQMLCCMGSPASVAEHIVGSSWGPMSWWLANRNGYLIGICCTGETRRSSATTADNKDIGVKLHNDGYSKPYTIRQCTAAMHSWIVVVGKIKSDNSNSGHSHSHSFSGGSAPGSMVAKEGPAKPWQSPFLKPYAFEEAVGTKVVESLHQVPNDAKKKECAVGHDVEAVKVVEKEKNVQYFDSFEDFKSYCCQQIVIEEYKTIPDSSSKGDSTSGASGSGGVDNTLNEQSTSSSYGVATNNYSIRVQVKNNIRHKIEIVIRNGSQA